MVRGAKAALKNQRGTLAARGLAMAADMVPVTAAENPRDAVMPRQNRAAHGAGGQPNLHPMWRIVPMI